MIIYTCVTNGYDKLSTPYIDPDVRYVCFYDGEKPTAEGWEYIPLGLEIECPVRRSYHPKHLPQVYFKEGDVTVWVDAAYNVTQDVVEDSRELFKTHDFVMQNHPDKRTMLSEFGKIFLMGFSTRKEILSMARKIKATGYELKHYKHTINSLILRRLTPEVIDWCNEWRKWYDVGINRDQISSAVAEYMIAKRYKSPLAFKTHLIDIKLDMRTTNRVKPYHLAYNMHKVPTKQEQIDIVDELGRIFNGDGDKYSVSKMYASVRYTPMELNEFVSKKDICIYTCITNGYDEIPSDNYYDPDVTYVCFHDGTVDTTVGPWQYVDIREYHQEECPRRLSFYPKAMPHLFFPEGTHTIWIDGCYQHTKEFIYKSQNCFPFTMLRHASRFTYFDEMLEGFTCAFFTYDDAILLTKKLKEADFPFRKYGSPLGTIVWRTMSREMNKFNEEWYKWSLIGCNRDQIAYDAALRFSGIQAPSVYENRGDSGIPLGYFNKKGRKGMHPQRGDLQQYKRQKELLNEMKEITGLSPKLHTRYKDHEFYMKVYNII